MAIAFDKLESLMKQGFPHAEIKLDDMLGDADHYGVTLVCDSFDGLNRVQRHQKVYKVLGDLMGGDLHALSIRARTPDEFKNLQQD